MRSFFIVISSLRGRIGRCCKRSRSLAKRSRSKQRVFSAIPIRIPKTRADTPAILVQFTDKSPEVLVGIGQKALPFLSNKNLTVQETCDSDRRVCRRQRRFPAAAREKKGRSRTPADLQVIDTYRAMRKKKPQLQRS